MIPESTFKVGDKCEVIDKRNPLFGKVFPVSRLEPGVTWFNVTGEGELFREMYCDNMYLGIVFKLAECDHNWQRITMFRFDEFCCTKCPAKRAFDITKDAA